MQRRLLTLFAFTLLAVACGETTTVEPGSANETQGTSQIEESEDSAAEFDDSVEDYPGDDAPVAAPQTGEILEPANALLADVPGWTAVDSYYWEPLGFEPSPDCAALNDVLALEEWGIPTAFWLRDGVELFQHAADLNAETNVAQFLEAFGSLDSSCPTATFGEATLLFEPLTTPTELGFSLTVPDDMTATWMFEAGRQSRSVAFGRANTVVIVTLVGSDEAELLELADLARARLEAVPAE